MVAGCPIIEESARCEELCAVLDARREMLTLPLF